MRERTTKSRPQYTEEEERVLWKAWEILAEHNHAMRKARATSWKAALHFERTRTSQANRAWGQKARARDAVQAALHADFNRLFGL